MSWKFWKIQPVIQEPSKPKWVVKYFDEEQIPYYAHNFTLELKNGAIIKFILNDILQKDYNHLIDKPYGSDAPSSYYKGDRIFSVNVHDYLGFKDKLVFEYTVDERTYCIDSNEIMSLEYMRVPIGTFIYKHAVWVRND